MRLIDADKLKERIGNTVLGDFWFQSIVDQQETVDAEPVRHGRWVNRPAYKGAEFSIYTCSECGEPWWFTMKYCGNCGAKLDMEEK